MVLKTNENKIIDEIYIQKISIFIHAKYLELEIDKIKKAYYTRFYRVRMEYSFTK
tara:strand:- start:438 stop:602 length:165 start_codon:yes stop_codon:yes gene_type:complete